MRQTASRIHWQTLLEAVQQPSQAIGEPPAAAAVTADRRAVALDRGLQALELDASPEQRHQLLAFLELLLKWNSHYNLTAIRDPDAMLAQHLLDCLAVVRPLEARLESIEAARVLDAGSGAGLPGVVLAVMQPLWAVSCVDAVAKKAAFVAQAASELRLRNLRSEHSRVEALQQPPFDLIVSRAFASLSDFVDMTRASLASAGCWAAMKGRPPADEISALPATVQAFHVERLTVPGMDAQRCLVWMRRSAPAAQSDPASVLR